MARNDQGKPRTETPIKVGARLGGHTTTLHMRNVPQATATQFRASCSARYYLTQAAYLQALLDVHRDLLTLARHKDDLGCFAADLLDRYGIGPVNY